MTKQQTLELRNETSMEVPKRSVPQMIPYQRLRQRVDSQQSPFPKKSDFTAEIDMFRDWHESILGLYS